VISQPTSQKQIKSAKVGGCKLFTKSFLKLIWQTAEAFTMKEIFKIIAKHFLTLTSPVQGMCYRYQLRDSDS
jgi:hypothetical protein